MATENLNCLKKEKKYIMNLQELIEHSYGSQDNLFAGHWFDKQRALESIITADKEGVGFEARKRNLGGEVLCGVY